MFVQLCHKSGHTDAAFIHFVKTYFFIIFYGIFAAIYDTLLFVV